MKMKDLIQKIQAIEILKTRISTQTDMLGRKLNRSENTVRLQEHIKNLRVELSALEEEEIFN